MDDLTKELKKYQQQREGISSNIDYETADEQKVLFRIIQVVCLILMLLVAKIAIKYFMKHIADTKNTVVEIDMSKTGRPEMTKEKITYEDAVSKGMIEDEIIYKNLIPGKEYEITYNGHTIIFIPNQSSGKQKLKFPAQDLGLDEENAREDK